MLCVCASVKRAPMEEIAKNGVRPFFGFPPLTVLPIFFILGYSFLRQRQVNYIEQELSPGHDTLSCLLVRAELHAYARFICLDDEVQHCWNFLSCAGKSLHHSGSDIDEGREELRNQARPNFTVLTEAIVCQNERWHYYEKEHEPKRPDGLHRGNTPSMNFANVDAAQHAFDLDQKIGPSVGEIIGDNSFKSGSELNCNVTGGRGSEKSQDVRA